MIETEPLWTYETPRHRRMFYGSKVVLTPECVVGDWFCLERATGTPLWERTPRQMGRANTIRGVAGGVIVASETRHDGPWVADFGIYRIALSDGRLLGTSHGPGGWGKFLRLLDFVPDFTNEIRDTPVLVRNNRIFTQGGRILDPETGSQIGFTHAAQAIKRESQTPEIKLTFQRSFNCGEWGVLYRGTPDNPEEPTNTARREPLRLYLRGADGNVRWTFDVAAQNDIGYDARHTDEFDFPLKIVPPFLYILARDGGLYLRSESGSALQSRRSLFQLWTLDMRSGDIVQKIPVNRTPTTSGSLEDVDAAGLLVEIRGDSGKEQSIHYFARRK